MPSRKRDLSASMASAPSNNDDPNHRNYFSVTVIEYHKTKATIVGFLLAFDSRGRVYHGEEGTASGSQASCLFLSSTHRKQIVRSQTLKASLQWQACIAERFHNLPQIPPSLGDQVFKFASLQRDIFNPNHHSLLATGSSNQTCPFKLARKNWQTAETMRKMTFSWLLHGINL